MSSLELLEIVNLSRAEFGEKIVRHSDFAARCRDELDGEYYEIFVVRNSRGPATEAIRMTADQCRLVAMRESKAVRRKVLDKLKSIESPQAVAIPQSYAAALLEAGRLAQLAEQQAAQLAIAAPKVEFVDRYVENTGTLTFRQVAKLLKANERVLRQLLIEGHVMYRLNGVMTPYQNHIDAGRFEVKTGTSERNNHAFAQARFTPKGVQWIAGLWASHTMQEAA
ncbi:phage antirepressor KilAC domain-containing protein [Stutzerimonas kunmingensis]|uniref:phage antirepressor KilAC domain-containing protein n=1 Tax=Stutzerimonas kunmingensis TaxID=1211807 RepID=UPI00241D1862|nr:phage antirepressor KilAC domain-containing protein [Stutzerimonas kunmingensis]